MGGSLVSRQKPPGVCEGREGLWVREGRAFSERLIGVEQRGRVELGWTRILFSQLEMTHSSLRNWSKVLLGSFH